VQPPPPPPPLRRRWFKRSFGGPRAALLAILALAAGIAVSLLEATERVAAAVGSTSIFLVLFVALARCNAESAMAVSHAGHIAAPHHRLLGTIDSGATTTAISTQRVDMLDRITDEHPDIQLQIADDKYLEVVAIGEMSRKVHGYRLTPSSDAPPSRWAEVPAVDVLRSTGVLVPSSSMA